jgi:hypothetical protein
MLVDEATSTDGAQNGILIATVNDTVHDTASLGGDVSGNAGGTVTYRYYTDSACTQNVVVVGDPETVTNGVADPSDPVTFTTTGTRFWQATYSGDDDNALATSSCTEQLIVNKAAPTLSTTLSGGGKSGKNISVDSGTAVHDSATLTGKTTDAGGTVTYTYYPTLDACNSSTGGTTAGTKTVSAGSVPDSDTVTLTGAQTVYWRASYSGDTKNDPVDSACDEILNVGKTATSLSTTLVDESGDVDTPGLQDGLLVVANGSSVHDTADLSDNTGTAGGTVTYSYYSDSGCSEDEVVVSTENVTNGVVDPSDSVPFNQAGDYYWLANYSGDTQNGGSQSPCTELLTVDRAVTSLSTTLVDNNNSSNVGVPDGMLAVDAGTPVHDTATLTGATADVGGTIAYNVYTDSTCSTAFASPTPDPDDVSAAGVPDSTSLTLTAAGSYYWEAVYSGDPNNDPATSDCQEVLVVAPVTAEGAPAITSETSATSVPVGQSVTDTATFVSPNGGELDGTVTFNVCGPSDSPPVCTTGGAPVAGVGNGRIDGTSSDTMQSRAFTPTEVGVYCFRVNYAPRSSSAFVATSHTNIVIGEDGECFTATTAAPTVSTSLADASGDIGQTPTVQAPATVHDTATLQDATPDAGGTATYWYYPNDPTCTTGGVQVGDPVTVDAGQIPPSDAVPFETAGDYYWQVNYSGDTNNLPDVSTCGDEILHVTDQNITSVTTLLSGGGQGPAKTISVPANTTVTDQATILNATAAATGTMTYRWYATDNCTGSPTIASTEDVDLDVGPVPASDGVPFSTPGVYSWRAQYSGDADNLGSTSPCDEILTVTEANPNTPTLTTSLDGGGSNTGAHITVAPSTQVHDTATLTGATPTAGGSISYAVYSNSNCTTLVQNATPGNNTITDPTDIPDSQNVTLTTPGVYYWMATYTGDAQNTVDSTTCGDETLTVSAPGQNTPTLSTILEGGNQSGQSISVPAGTAVHDTADLTGETTDAGGTVTYRYYTNSTCSTGVQTVSTENVNNGVVDDSNDVTFNTAGTFYWQATYSGDTNNAGTTSPCNEVLTVTGGGGTPPPGGGGFPTLEELLDPAFWLQQLHDLLVLLGIDPGAIGLGEANLSSLTPPAATADAPANSADVPNIPGMPDIPGMPAIPGLPAGTAPGAPDCLGPELTQARRLARGAGAYDLTADQRALVKELVDKLEHYNNPLGCG